MLAPLDNETIFKKAFTNKIVFEQFVLDIFGKKVRVNKIETEKKYSPKSGFVDLAIDIYAETIDHRFIIEIQRIDYDHNFDRFLYYFIQAITEQQKSSKDYTINQEVLAVVVLTQPYLINKKTGNAIQDNVMTLDFDLKNLKGEIINIWGHNLFFLNAHPKYQNNYTPPNYQDWLNLFRQSVHKNEILTLNLNNKGIAKVVELIDYEKTTPQERRLIKITESKKVMKAKERDRFENVKNELEQNKHELEQNKHELEQNKHELEQKEVEIEQNKHELEQKYKSLINSAKIMKHAGIKIQQIQQATNLTITEIENL